MLAKRLLPFAAIFLVIETCLRLSLLARAFFDVEFEYTDIASLLVRGIWFDVVTASFALLLPALYHTLLLGRWHGGRWDRITDMFLRFLFSFVLLFDAIAEHLFWTEFTTRFNFIAIDYLIYTQEVIGNIMESYPVYPMLAMVAVTAMFITWISTLVFPFRTKWSHIKTRGVSFTALVACCGLLYAVSSIDQSHFDDNTEASELAANGIYNLFYSFSNNEISYDRFYATESEAEVEKNARVLLEEEGQDFVHSSGRDLTRLIRMPGAEKHKNVIIVSMESLSADYMGTFGNKDGLTPNLDRLAKEGILFANTYATGTRTVRGLEAITLSIPPTPGQSIIRRPGNENLFSLGFIFKDRGYDTKFIYGGYGYFDNMNAFFAGNGFDVLDRNSVDKSEINFANVWGICDEDMFTRAIKEADQSFAKGKPFAYLIMTTSNHRPFTFPDGRIDIASHSGRLGGVKYADYSVGKLIADAQTKPWFKDTVFLFVSDHTAGAGGKAELDPHKYHIPMIYYAPGFLAPKRYESVSSQIDAAPILLGMLNFSYYTKFYGEDLLNDHDEIPHAFISNYQKVALVKDKGLTVLGPKRKIEHFSWPEVVEKPDLDKGHAADAITYYQSASWWRDQYRRIPTTVTQSVAGDLPLEDKTAR